MPTMVSTKVPEEVWRRIFLIAYESCYREDIFDHGLWIEDYRSLSMQEELVMKLSEVCQAWTRLSRSTAKLWTHITCPFGDALESDRTSWLHFKRGLELSKHQLISVRLYLCKKYRIYLSNGLSDPFRVLVPYFPRIQRFVIAIESNDTASSQLGTALFPDSFLATLPMPKSGLWDGGLSGLLSRNRPWTGLPLAELRTMTLYEVTLTSTSNLVLLLQYCTKLEILIFSGVDLSFGHFSAPPRYPVLRLPSLVGMCIDRQDLAFMSELPLLTPELKRLEIHKTPASQFGGRPIDFSFATALKHLELVSHFLPPSDDDVLAIVRDTPNLVQLSLRGCETGRDFIVALCTCSLNEGFLLPHLLQLDVFDGNLDNEDVLLFLENRNSARNLRSQIVRIVLVQCKKITGEMELEVKSRNRGICQLADLEIMSFGASIPEVGMPDRLCVQRTAAHATVCRITSGMKY